MPRFYGMYEETTTEATANSAWVVGGGTRGQPCQTAVQEGVHAVKPTLRGVAREMRRQNGPMRLPRLSREDCP